MTLDHNEDGEDFFDLGDTLARYVNGQLDEDETMELFEHLPLRSRYQLGIPR